MKVNCSRPLVLALVLAGAAGPVLAEDKPALPAAKAPGVAGDAPPLNRS